MSRSYATLALTLCLSTTLLACGGTAQVPPHEPDLSPPPAGKVAVVVPRAVTPVEGDLRVAVVWSTYDISDIFKPGKIKNVAISADVPVSGDLPSRVLLDVKDIEKGPTSNPASPFLTFGSTILYQDTNKNGRLDLAPFGAAKTVDRLVGTADHLAFFIITGDGQGEGVKPGLHLIKVPATSELPPVCDQPMPESKDVPLDTVIQIPHNASARFELALCDEMTIDTTAVCDLSGGAGKPEVSCNADYSGFVAAIVEDRGTACAHWVYCTSRECPAPTERPEYCPSK